MHHAQILMQQDVAVKHKRSAMVGSRKSMRTFTLWYGHSPTNKGFRWCPQIRIGHRFSVDFLHQEVNLVDVKCVRLQRAVFNDPIFTAPTLVVITGFSLASKTFAFVHRR